MKILTIGSDRKIFEEGSEVRTRILEYGKLFTELHIIIFSQERTNSRIKIGENVFIYSTESRNRWFYIKDAISLGKKILKENTDGKNWILSSQDPFESGWVVYKLAKKFSCKFQLQIHTDFLSPYFSRGLVLNKIRLFLAKKIIPHADGVRAVSERIKESLINHFAIPASKIIVLPIFIDVSNLKNSNGTIDLHKKYPQFEKIILMATRLSGEKNVGLAVDVFSEVVKKFPKVGLVITGEGGDREKLEFRIRNYELGKNVILEGFQNKETLFSYYKTADLFLQTSLFEGYGLALAEALLSGLRAVSSDVGIAKEVALGEEFLSICPVNDKACFVQKIEEMLQKEKAPLQSGIEFERKFISSKSEYLEKYKKTLSL